LNELDQDFEKLSSINLIKICSFHFVEFNEFQIHGIRVNLKSFQYLMPFVSYQHPIWVHISTIQMFNQVGDSILFISLIWLAKLLSYCFILPYCKEPKLLEEPL